jgi:DNA modification methylase
MSKEMLGSLELNRIYAMDCVEGMKMLPDECIDLTVTSPPYDNLRAYNGYSFDFEAVANELYRITKPGGVVVWVVGDATVKGSETGTSFRQALYFKEIGFNLHDTMIYAKYDYVPLTHNRYEQQFEYMFVFSKGKPKTFNPIKIPCKYAGQKNTTSHRRNSDELEKGSGYGKEVKPEKIKPNIWFYNVGKNKSTKDKVAHKHPAIFPEQLATDHIISWSNHGDIVLDPFMGSGTTAKMALLNNRRFIGFEISSEYVEIANKRIKEALANV